VNEQVGREGGDLLLQQFAARLQALLAKGDMLARLGSDKFALLLPASSPPNRGLSLGGQILAACTEPFIVNGQLISLQLSIGLALCPDHAADADGLMQAGEQALAQATRTGGGRLHMFRHEDVTRLRAAPAPREPAPPPEPGNLRDELRGALARGEIRLLYQPVYHLRDMTLSGFDALPRWQHPVHGLLLPEQFMPAVEEAGLSHELGVQLIERVCAEALSSGAPRVAFNICNSQIQDPHLPARISAILRKTGLKPEQLEIEISESQLSSCRDQALTLISSLRTQGVGVVLGEFGSGSSSLGALCSLPVTRVKIDRRFVQKLGQDQTADAIVSAVLSLAGNLHLTVTALGLESEAQLAQLRQQGCHTGQGPLLGEPASRAVARQPARAAVS
jgi:diguanylate cyclase (GGDEF)-like protein